MSGITDRLEREGGWREAEGTVRTGPRAEIAAELANLAGGCLFQDIDTEDARIAAERIGAGAVRARVGTTWYYPDAE